MRWAGCWNRYAQKPHRLRLPRLLRLFPPIMGKSRESRKGADLENNTRALSIVARVAAVGRRHRADPRQAAGPCRYPGRQPRTNPGAIRTRAGGVCGRTRIALGGLCLADDRHRGSSRRSRAAERYRGDLLRRLRPGLYASHHGCLPAVVAEWPRALGCPWCAVCGDAGRYIPRPRVRCEGCQHYQPDTVNPPGGLGDCKDNHGSHYPMQRHRFASFQPGKEGTP